MVTLFNEEHRVYLHAAADGKLHGIHPPTQKADDPSGLFGRKCYLAKDATAEKFWIVKSATNTYSLRSVHNKYINSKKYPALFDQASAVGADSTFRWTFAKGGEPGYFRIQNLGCKGQRSQTITNCNVDMGKRLCNSYGGCPAGFSIEASECRIPRRKWDYNCERVYNANSNYYEKVLDWEEQTNTICKADYDSYDNAHFDWCKWMCMARSGCPNGFSFLPSAAECRFPKKSHNWDCKPGSFAGAAYYKPLDWKIP